MTAVVERTIDRLRGRPKGFRFLTPAEYEQLCSTYRIPVDGGIMNSLRLSRAQSSKMTYGKEFFSACGAGSEARIAKKVRSPVLMPFTRNDPFFDVRGAYDVLTRIESFDKSLVQVDVAGHYSIIESGRDCIGEWMAARLPQST